MLRLFLARVKLRLMERLTPGELHLTLVMAALIGVLGALATIGFRELIAGIEYLLFGRNDGLVKIAVGLVWWQRVLYPTVGGLCAGVILHWAARWATAGASADYMEAIALGDGRIGLRASLVRAASSALSVSCGASIGREASMVQLAALTGSLLGRFRHVNRPRMRLLVACGAAAGIAAAYNAPIAGALFVSEIMLQSFAIETLGPLIVASVVSNLVTHPFLGFGPVYHMPSFTLQLGVEVAAYALLGVVAGLLAPLFLLTLDGVRRAFHKLPQPLWARLGIGGLVVGLISILSPAVWGNGYSVVDSVLQGDWAWRALLTLLLLKVLATAVSTGSGAVGGVFTPTLFVGAVIGALFSTALHVVWPGASLGPAYVATGMGAFLAAMTHAPLMSAIMIFEMTGNNDVIAPLLLACVIAYVIKRVLYAPSVYARALVTSPMTSSAHTARSLLRRDPPVVQEGATLASVEQAFISSRWQHVYVCDAASRLIGAVSLHDFGPFLRQQQDGQHPLPASLIRTDYPRVTGDANLGTVMEAFTHHTGERLPVVTPNGELLGYVSKTDLMLVLQESAAGG